MRWARWLLGGVTVSLTSVAHASFLSGAALDSAANFLAWFVLIAMPPAAIVLFWMVHVLPQKAAEKRHHPQKEAIHVLCLLSLVFGGLLWPFAWLWAYTRPALHAMAHGTERHEDFYHEETERAERGELERERIASLRAELDRLETTGHLTPRLRALRDRLARTEGAESAPAATGPRAAEGAA